MVEFSQPNSLKAFHVGHLRNMVLGAAISNILEKSGDEVIRANYLGDIGLHVITWLWNYLQFHNG
jgi:arginyl-tRNA synthetase